MRLSAGLVTLSILTAAGAQGAEEAVPKGWDTRYGLVFSLSNVFQQPTILGGYRTYGVGAQYNLSPHSALRFGLGFNHVTDPAYVTDRTVTNITAGGTTTTTTRTLVLPAQWTSSTAISLGADYLVALGDGPFMPYVGAGLGLSYASNTRAYTDDIDPANVVKVDNGNGDFALGAEGLLGVEWRVHRGISVYAEYSLSVGLFDHLSTHTRTTTLTTVPTQRIDETSGSRTQWLNTDVSLAQGGSLGVLVHF